MHIVQYCAFEGNRCFLALFHACFQQSSPGCVLVEEVQEDFEREARYNAHVSEEVVKNHSLGLGKRLGRIWRSQWP